MKRRKATLSISAAEKSSMDYIFVHGLSGWGSYDRANRTVPY